MRKHNLQQRLLLLLIFVLLISCTVDGEQINDATVTPLPATPTVQPQQQDESGASVIEKLHSAEIEITDIHTHDEDSFFDLLFGEDVAEWISLSADDEPVNIYEFASADAVAAALAARQGNGYLFRLTRADGTIAQMNLNGNPYFWQDGNVLIHVPLASVELTEKLESAVGTSIPWHVRTMPEKKEEVRVRVYNDSDVDFESVEVGWAETQQIGAVPARGYSDYFTFEYAYHYGYVIALVDGKEYSFRPIDYVGESYLAAGDYTFALTPVDGDEYDHLATQMVRDGSAAINPRLTGKRWYWAAALSQDGSFSFPTDDTPYFELTSESADGRLLLNAFDGCETFSVPYQLGVQYGIVTFDMPAPTCGDARFFNIIDKLAQIDGGDQFLRLHTTDWDAIVMTQAEPTGSHTDPAALAPTMLKAQYFDAVEAATPQFANSAAWTFDYFDQAFTAHVFADAMTAQAAGLQVEDAAWVFENVLITYRPNPNSRIGSLEDMLTDALGASLSSENEEAVMIESEQPFELGVGQSAELPTTTLTLTAVTNDSRCPVDVECFWAGEATVEFVTSDGESFTLVIGGSNGTDERATHAIGDFLLQIEALTPEPHSEQPIAPEDYRATLRLIAGQSTGND